MAVLVWLFGFSGRIGRLGYLARLLVANGMTLFGALLFGNPRVEDDISLAFWPLLALAVWAAISGTVRRLHHLNGSTWWTLLLLVPLLQLVFVAVLLIAPHREDVAISA